jgi:hypothetical protein
MPGRALAVPFEFVHAELAYRLRDGSREQN